MKIVGSHRLRNNSEPRNLRNDLGKIYSGIWGGKFSRSFTGGGSRYAIDWSPYKLLHLRGFHLFFVFLYCEPTRE